MKFLNLLLANCLNCSHVVPIYCENTWELSTCKKFNDRYADMCRMDEGKCGKNARHFSPKEVKNIDKIKNSSKPTETGFSMELDCM